jgi:hypothetical protein
VDSHESDDRRHGGSYRAAQIPGCELRVHDSTSCQLTIVGFLERGRKYCGAA